MTEYAEETVDVVIQATERVEYYQTVRMPKAEFEKLDKMLDSDDREERQRAEEKVQMWLDARDILYASGFELEDFHLADPAA